MAYLNGKPTVRKELKNERNHFLLRIWIRSKNFLKSIETFNKLPFSCFFKLRIKHLIKLTHADKIPNFHLKRFKYKLNKRKFSNHNRLPNCNINDHKGAFDPRMIKKKSRPIGLFKTFKNILTYALFRTFSDFLLLLKTF